MPSKGRPKAEPTSGKYIVYRPSDFLWIGICVNFAQAFSTWLHVPDRDNWFIGRMEEHQLAIKSRGRWVKFGEPRPYRKKNYLRYRGPINEQFARKRKIDRERQQRIRDEKRRAHLPPWLRSRV